MKWSESVFFKQPLREVSLLAGAPMENWDAVLRAREEAGYARGRRDGEKALSHELVQQRAEIAELQRGVLESLSRAVPRVIEESESALIALALEAARRVVAGLPIDAALVEGVVQEALRQVEDTAEITIQLHPEDLELLRKQDSKILKGPPERGPLRFISSSEVTRGGCIVQTRFGVIDARREIKLEQLTQTACS